MDRIAAICGSDDADAIAALYTAEALTVPEAMLRST